MFAIHLKANPSYKPFAAFFLFAAFFAQSFSKSLIAVGYYNNTAAYAKNCVNKARPTLKCNGKCQMMKKLAQEEKKDTETPERKSGNSNEVLLSSRSFFATIVFPTTELISTKSLAAHVNGYAIDCCMDVFHPPRYS